MIPRWLEHRTHSYQKYTLPIKLRNLYDFKFKIIKKITRALRFELRIWSLKLPILPIKLYSLSITNMFIILLITCMYKNVENSEKRWFEHPGV